MKEELKLQIEKEIAEHLTLNSFSDAEEEVLDCAMLLSCLYQGYKNTIRDFGRRKFLINLVKNGAISKDEKFFISEEDEQYPYIWFVMTLCVGKGFIMRQ